MNKIKAPSLVCLNKLKHYQNDLISAFKLVLSPHFKMPLLGFIQYFANMAANKIPGIRKMAGRRRKVNFSEYMLAYDKTSASLVPYREMLGRIVELLEIKGGELIADLGAGTGNLTRGAEEKGAKVISIDCSTEANRIHRDKYPDAFILNVDIDRKERRTGLIPIAKASLDRVCAANLWTYIRNRADLYTEIRRILKKDGFFVLAVERRGYSPLDILKDHLLKEYRRYRKEGMLPATAVIQVYVEFISKYDELLITAEETKKLMRGIAAGDYAVFTEDEIIRELQNNGFEVLKSEISYANQAIIIKAKPALSN